MTTPRAKRPSQARSAAARPDDLVLAARLLAYSAVLLQALDDPTAPVGQRATADESVSTEVASAVAQVCAVAGLLLAPPPSRAEGALAAAAAQAVGGLSELGVAAAGYREVAAEVAALARALAAVGASAAADTEPAATADEAATTGRQPAPWMRRLAEPPAAVRRSERQNGRGTPPPEASRPVRGPWWGQ